MKEMLDPLEEGPSNATESIYKYIYLLDPSPEGTEAICPGNYTLGKGSNLDFSRAISHSA